MTALVSMIPYYTVVVRAPEVVRVVEDGLAQVPEGVSFTASEFHIRLRAAHTLDLTIQVLWALSAMGALTQLGEAAFVAEGRSLARTASERVGARGALGWMAAVAETQPELLVSAPGGITNVASNDFGRDFSDLRTTVRALIAGARSRLFLASPYWDLDVARDLGGLMARRVADGVAVRVLSRRPRAGTSTGEGFAELRKVIKDGRESGLRILEERCPTDTFGSRTFHFKLAVADGKTAYVGSANFNTAGMASRWELGVLVRGESARVLDELAQTLYGVSQPVPE